ncbi:hypothetical protein [Amycolatopsis regifaucium]|uniref:Uncharacterized protein n=1 Tax=Amycolatopsis regifaucium TaxID=546365 RepID=A0A154M763_9PSEU|nr:hypothetical protein [Amycolatopsis regifaucium]KZB80455.1 hypothetical protein AVL48_12530 [Amycolatopsis regifaucium]OKA05425.1 hypothetical protein ATP06_0226350 [Amycolatopsis regifaucium]SFJ04460.1 hypothetical protein SAMN04489731_11540 [Amycolatopsis regifaucium]
MLGHEQNAPRPQRLTLPPTVVASHLRGCADDLAASLTASGTAATVPELLQVVEHLVAGQQALATALEGMAVRVEGGGAGALAAAPQVDVEVVAEVLRAAATAVGCSADALAEARPSFECVSESVAPDTRL